MVFAPRFSPDGDKVAFSVEQGGNTDIYVMDLHSHATRRLTTDPSIDTSPSFSPDGGQIVFNSDRGGSPQLYVMNADGSDQHRISFGDGRYTDPVWSPGRQPDRVRQAERFDLPYRGDETRRIGERILTTSYLDEGPTWAPNGRVIMFFREGGGGGPRLWTVDVTGQIAQAGALSRVGLGPGLVAVAELMALLAVGTAMVRVLFRTPRREGRQYRRWPRHSEIEEQVDGLSTFGAQSGWR